jgi:methylmalonyl-CoA mutase, C-terminal domain
MNMKKPIRILLAKAGCDIHERGVLTLLNVFRDAGMEVIYTGRYQTPEGIANAAVTEDVDLIAISDLTGSLEIIARQVITALKQICADDIPIIVGGLMTAEDEKALAAMGVAGAFGTGSPTDIIVRCVKKIVEGR